VGKFATALELVKWLKCKSPDSCDGSCSACKLIAHLDHPDIEVIVPMPKTVSDSPEMTSQQMAEVARDPFAELVFDKVANIGIDQIRQLSEKLFLAPTSDGGRWAIIRDAEAMTIEASNAFLKTLEEPPDDAHIILTSSHPDSLLPTIRSRTQPIRFTRLSRRQVVEILISRGVSEDDAEKVSYYADGSITAAIWASGESGAEIMGLGEELWVCLFSRNDALLLDFTEKIGRDRSLSEATIKAAISLIRDHLLFQIGVGDIAANKNTAARLERAAVKYADPEPLGRTIGFLEKKAYELRYNPQYELFWMDLIIRGRALIQGKTL